MLAVQVKDPQAVGNQIKFGKFPSQTSVGMDHAALAVAIAYMKPM